tara:strand:- start:256 stop:993 length:738 start_codon:yes stop_codon:yes gene_type:complete
MEKRQSFKTDNNEVKKENEENASKINTQKTENQNDDKDELDEIIPEVKRENEENTSKINTQKTENQTDGKDELDEIKPEVKIINLEDKLARTFAEMENQRRRFEKEKEEAYEYGGFAFAKEALNLIDNLDRSKLILENDGALKNSEALKKTLEHLDIIYKDLISIFSKNNIHPIESLNKKLDPNLHQAMIEIEDDQKEVGTIVQEIQKGFTIKDRLLRPSLVGVSKKTSNKEAKDEENNEKTINK